MSALPRLAADPGLPHARRLELAADGCVSVAEAVVFAGVSQAELYRSMDRGDVPFVKWGKRRLIPRVALVELLAARLVGG